MGIGGSGGPSQELEVFGDIAAARYCDSNGNNCRNTTQMITLYEPEL